MSRKWCCDFRPGCIQEWFTDVPQTASSLFEYNVRQSLYGIIWNHSALCLYPSLTDPGDSSLPPSASDRRRKQVLVPYMFCPIDDSQSSRI